MTEIASPVLATLGAQTEFNSHFKLLPAMKDTLTRDGLRRVVSATKPVEVEMLEQGHVRWVYCIRRNNKHTVALGLHRRAQFDQCRQAAEVGIREAASAHVGPPCRTTRNWLASKEGRLALTQ